MKGFAVVLLVATVAAIPDNVFDINRTQCPPEQEENWGIEMLLRHEDCNKFYKCTFGQPVEYKCYGDLYFNLETWQCDWPENVDCTDRNIPDPTTTLEPTTEEATEPATESTTTEEPTTTTTEPTTTTTEPTTTTTEPTTTTTEPTTTTTEPTTTTTEPTTTTTEPTTTTTEPTTTTTEPTTTTTEPTTTTTEPTTTTTEPTTTTTTTTTTEPPTTTMSTTTTTTTVAPETEAPGIDFAPNGCPVNPHIHWLLPHEENCNQFYYCVWGQLVLRDCPATLSFNPILQVCDWPWDAGCTAGSRSLNKHLEVRSLLRQLL